MTICVLYIVHYRSVLDRLQSLQAVDEQQLMKLQPEDAQIWKARHEKKDVLARERDIKIQQNCEDRVVSSTVYTFLQGGPKNVSLYFCPYLRQLLTDFQNSFTDTLCRQFAIM